MEVTVQSNWGIGPFPALVLPGGKKLERPHAEWNIHQLRWRWLLDSWEGGEAYRNAVYGFDGRGMPVRNMIRHKREYPQTFDSSYGLQNGRPDGTDMANQATDDDYELRRARTPVPTFVAECVDVHTSKVYKREVKREGPPSIIEWWEDVDGKGESIDQWMFNTIAPLLLVLGQLDIIVENPPVPPGEKLASDADVRRLNIDVPVASYILPENMVWWDIDRKGCYNACLIKEVRDDHEVQWRYWDAKVWAIYDKDGKAVGSPTPHTYGCVPIRRVFDRRRPRCRNVGLPRYEVVAELQREYYNRDSELILSDTIQAHPLLQGPEDVVKPDGTMPIGPSWLLMKIKNAVTGDYEGFDVIEFPKDGAESIRLNKHDLRDAVDRSACLTKPAGAAGTNGNTVSQSGTSKQMDASTGNDLLGKVSKTLERCEDVIACLYWCVVGQEASEDKTTVVYPTEFDLAGALELADLVGRLQMILSTAGIAPEIEGPLISRLIKAVMPGLDDKEYEAMDLEAKRVLAQGPPEPDNGGVV